MEWNNIAQEIIDHLGGVDNITSIASCMTRVRCTILEEQKVDFAALEKVEHVIRVVQGDMVQIVVGPGKSFKIVDAMKELHKGTEHWKEVKAQVSSKRLGISGILKRIANIFTPLIPAIIGAGLMNGIAGYFVNLNVLNGITEIPIWITFLQTLGSGLFAYFAIYVGINTANEFGATPGLGGIIGAITISPNINTISKQLNLYDIETPLNSILTTGKGGIIGVIFGVIILSYIEKKLRKIVPDVITTFVTPVVSLSIVGMLLIFILMPIAGVISDGIINIFALLILSEGWMSIVGGFILAASFLPLLMVGLHHGLIPFYLVQLEQTGAISLFAILCMAGGGQIGATIAIYVKAKNNPKLRNIIRSALPVGFLGIGEPLLYGVTLPLGKPFLTASIAGGIGGSFIALFQVQTIAFGPAGLTAIPLVVPDKILYYFLGICIAYTFGFIITYFFGIPKNLDEF